ncbi:hypothetical protein [Leifsonia poae]|uniref:Uncharacterized protein n=1 Tax=Leifsonia poae TaxID=110933 RepID=A0A9W6HDG5_9MICO|nr:hypothetical protein [Leifsonia poae]GLJ78040.1 hypothetical protein GCM10017584_36140 [Leifsonia poae]
MSDDETRAQTGQPEQAERADQPGRRRISRRALVIGGAAAAAVVVAGVGVPVAIENRLLPGRSTFNRVFGLDGAAGTIPSVEPGPMTSGTFRSAARLGAECGWR